MNKTIVTTVMTLTAMGSLLLITSCSSANLGTMRGDEHGIIRIEGDARGIEAYHQGMHGLVESAKNEKGEARSTHAVYVEKERERSRRQIEYKSPFANFLGLGGQK